MSKKMAYRVYYTDSEMKKQCSRLNNFSHNVQSFMSYRAASCFVGGRRALQLFWREKFRLVLILLINIVNVAAIFREVQVRCPPQCPRREHLPCVSWYKTEKDRWFRAAEAAGKTTGPFYVICNAQRCQYIFPHRCRYPSMMDSPTGPDFSGWNWVPYTLPWATAAQMRRPP